MNELKHCYWPISIKYLLLINVIDYSAFVSGQSVYFSILLFSWVSTDRVPILVSNDFIDIINISTAIWHAGHRPDFPLAHM